MLQWEARLGSQFFCLPKASCSSTKQLETPEVPCHLVPLYARGWNLKEAARACGCSPSHLRAVMQGEREPSAELKSKLAALKQKPLSVNFN